MAKPHIYVGRDGGDAAMHGTPHRYDTEVPIVVYGPGAVPGVERTRVTPRQIATTISRILGLPPDSHAAEELPGSS